MNSKWFLVSHFVPFLVGHMFFCSNHLSSYVCVGELLFVSLSPWERKTTEKKSSVKSYANLRKKSNSWIFFSDWKLKCEFILKWALEENLWNIERRKMQSKSIYPTFTALSKWFDKNTSEDQLQSTYWVFVITMVSEWKIFIKNYLRSGSCSEVLKKIVEVCSQIGQYS